jgi:hypothetical protein
VDFSAVVSAGEVCPEEAVSFSPKIVSGVTAESRVLAKNLQYFLIKCMNEEQGFRSSSRSVVRVGK